MDKKQVELLLRAACRVSPAFHVFYVTDPTKHRETECMVNRVLDLSGRSYTWERATSSFHLSNETTILVASETERIRGLLITSFSIDEAI